MVEVVAAVALVAELEVVGRCSLVPDLRWYSSTGEHLPPGTALVLMELV